MLPGLAFLLQAKGLIDVGKSPIQLRAGASKALNDVSSSSLAARVAQGLAILYGHHLGYKFAAHLSSHVQALPPGSPGAKHKDDAMADFLFANGSHSVIVESKGTFSLEENKPTAIKSVLKGALEKQVDPWMKHLQPAPSNGFVVYTCLREPSWVPSALFVVDPEESNDGTRAVPMSQDQIVRANYVGWLRAMGLVEAAARLGGQYLEPEHAAPEEIRFVTAMIEGRKYAFRDEPEDWLPKFWPWRLPHMGIDFQVLKAISMAIGTPGGDLSTLLQDPAVSLAESQGAESIFPDGSYFGPIQATSFEIESVRL